MIPSTFIASLFCPFSSLPSSVTAHSHSLPALCPTASPPSSAPFPHSVPVHPHLSLIAYFHDLSTNCFHSFLIFQPAPSPFVLVSCNSKSFHFLVSFAPLSLSYFVLHGSSATCFPLLSATLASQLHLSSGFLCLSGFLCFLLLLSFPLSCASSSLLYSSFLMFPILPSILSVPA